MTSCVFLIKNSGSGQLFCKVGKEVYIVLDFKKPTDACFCNGADSDSSDHALDFRITNFTDLALCQKPEKEMKRDELSILRFQDFPSQ